MVFVRVQPKGYCNDDPPSRLEVLQAPVQHRPRIVDAIEDVPKHYTVETAHHHPRAAEVPFDQLHALAYLVRLLGQDLARKVERVGIDVHSGDLTAAPRKQQPNDAFATPHIQDARASSLAGHPVDSPSEPVAGQPKVEHPEICLGDAVPHVRGAPMFGVRGSRVLSHNNLAV